MELDLAFLIATVIKMGLYFTIVLTFVAYAVYAERRFSAIIQDRVGPNRTMIPTSILGFKNDIKLPLGGLTQPIADGLKFILKEDFTPAHVRKHFFWLAPCMTMVPSLITIAVIPFSSPIAIEGRDVPLSMAIADLNVGPLFIFAISSLAVYGIAIAGWASNSKFPFLGGIRASAQMISYEIALGLSIIPVLLVFGELNLGRIVQEQSVNGWLILPLWNEGGHILSGGFWDAGGLQQWILWLPMMLAFIIFTISIFAETNRTPFDLAECETELVGGYHTEYSSMKFALFFLGEYAAMVIGSALIVTMFLGGWSLPFGWSNAEWLASGGIIATFIHLGCFLTKVIGFILFFILVRWSIPRFRYDQLMKLGWVIFFELALINIVLTALLIARPALSGIEFGGALAALAAFSAFVFYLAKTIDNQVGPGKRVAPVKAKPAPVN
ncbi:complex I subunit 1/NuoH family protein [Roseibacillus persicicus]|uniref:complex I subunit 1/NuoH family protein n=1 Tax=Roseibacillus persicicus TaxID=454148 RepID=UPI00280C4189|nr:complex I subunit 1 family protein [Roseibacillus persicicus]MDQ8188775.1 NADH-quinone oxidoreductase subunit H [Roseibacillus persicicus]